MKRATYEAQVKKALEYYEKAGIVLSEEEKKKISRKVEKAKSLFRTLEATWPHMTDKEKQSVCQELIDRIVIHKDGVIDVHLKLRSYLINK